MEWSFLLMIVALLISCIGAILAFDAYCKERAECEILREVIAEYEAEKKLLLTRIKELGKDRPVTSPLELGKNYTFKIKSKEYIESHSEGWAGFLEPMDKHCGKTIVGRVDVVGDNVGVWAYGWAWELDWLEVIE